MQHMEITNINLYFCHTTIPLQPRMVVIYYIAVILLFHTRYRCLFGISYSEQIPVNTYYQYTVLLSNSLEQQYSRCSCFLSTCL